MLNNLAWGIVASIAWRLVYIWRERLFVDVKEKGRQDRNARPMGGFLRNLFPVKLFLVSTFVAITKECSPNIHSEYRWILSTYAIPYNAHESSRILIFHFSNTFQASGLFIFILFSSFSYVKKKNFNLKNPYRFHA